MSDDLYNAALVALAREKGAAGRLDAPDGSATADNPLCGDRVTIDVGVRDGVIDRVAQKTRGCILTQAAASMIARHAPGLDVAQAQALSKMAKDYLAGQEDRTGWTEMAMLEPVRAVRSRHDCVVIAFEALGEALADAVRDAG